MGYFDGVDDAYRCAREAADNEASAKARREAELSEAWVQFRDQLLPQVLSEFLSKLFLLKSPEASVFKRISHGRRSSKAEEAHMWSGPGYAIDETGTFYLLSTVDPEASPKEQLKRYNIINYYWPISRETLARRLWYWACLDKYGESPDYQMPGNQRLDRIIKLFRQSLTSPS